MNHNLKRTDGHQGSQAGDRQFWRMPPKTYPLPGGFAWSVTPHWRCLAYAHLQHLDSSQCALFAYSFDTYIRHTLAISDCDFFLCEQLPCWRTPRRRPGVGSRRAFRGGTRRPFPENTMQPPQPHILLILPYLPLLHGHWPPPAPLCQGDQNKKRLL